MQNRPDAPDFLRREIVIFELPENLRLTHHHGIETGGHAKEVTHRLVASVRVEMIFQVIFCRFRFLIQEESFDLQKCGLPVRGCGNHFNPVAGGENRAFLNRGQGT